MATEYHLITQNGTSGSYWASLTTEQKNRYYFGGSYLVYANFNAWRSALTSRASLFTDLVVECAGAWTDSSTYLVTTLSGWKSITITTKINGVYGSGFHNGIYGSGYVLTFTDTSDFLRLYQPYCIIDGLDIRTNNTGLNGSLLNLGSSSVRSIVKNNFITGANGSSTIGIKEQGSDADIQNNVIVGCGQYGFRCEYAIGDNVFLTGNIVYGCGTGFFINSSAGYVSAIGNISVGNTTNWGTTVPSGRGIAAYNFGLSGQAWDNTSTRKTIALTDFVNAASYDFRPASSSSPQVDCIPNTVSYLSRMPVDDITGFYYRPGYVTGTADSYDAGAYEYNWGNGNPPAYCNLTISAPTSLVGAEIRIYDYNNNPAGSFGTELAGVESCTTSTYSYTGLAGNTIYIQIMQSGWVEFGQTITLTEGSLAFYALMQADPNE